MWGVAHAAAAPSAASLLEQRGTLASLVWLAEHCPVLSLRGTAYYSLGLVAMTRPGAVALGQRGWATVRHQRGEAWPIAQDWLEPETGSSTAQHSPALSTCTREEGGWEGEGRTPGRREQGPCSLDSSLTVSPQGRERLSKRLSDKVTECFFINLYPGILHILLSNLPAPAHSRCCSLPLLRSMLLIPSSPAP